MPWVWPFEFVVGHFAFTRVGPMTSGCRDCPSCCSCVLHMNLISCCTIITSLKIGPTTDIKQSDPDTKVAQLLYWRNTCSAMKNIGVIISSLHSAEPRYSVNGISRPKSDSAYGSCSCRVGSAHGRRWRSKLPWCTSLGFRPSDRT